MHIGTAVIIGIPPIQKISSSNPLKLRALCLLHVFLLRCLPFALHELLRRRGQRTDRWRRGGRWGWCRGGDRAVAVEVGASLGDAAVAANFIANR